MLHKLFILALLLSSCSKLEMDSVRVYTIPEGNNYSKGIKGESLTSNVLHFKAMFKESANYHFDNIDSLDINKLYGFCDCNSTPHRNSSRFGWRVLSDQIEITSYAYNNGIRQDEIVLNLVNFNEWNEYTITIEKDYYVFNLNGYEVTENRTAKCEVGAYKLLYPYFGGNNKAPHEMTILIEILD